MVNWLEDLTKMMANDKMGRRAVMQRVAGSIAGIVLASWLPGHVLARTHPDGTKECPLGGCRCTDCGNCAYNPNTNCYCLSTFNTSLRGAVCICNTFCSQLSTCMSSSQCQAGFVCTTNNGCTGCSTSYGVCIARCKGKHKNCKLGSGQGLTVTGRVV